MATQYRSLEDKKGRRAHLQGEWATLYGKGEDRLTADDVSQLQAWNAEMDELGEEIAQLDDLRRMSSAMPKGAAIVPNGDGSLAPATDAQLTGALRSTRDVLRAAFPNGIQLNKPVEFGADTVLGMSMNPAERGATLITLSDGAPQNTRLARMEPYPVERRTVADLFAQGTMDTNVLEYYEETTFTNAAAETAEGTSKPEAALDWTLRTETASKVPVWIPATTESLEDISWLRSTIENRLRFMLQRRIEAQLLNGDGTTPNISGITDRSGIQTQAKGSDPVFDALLKAATLIQVNSFYEPDAVVMHPNDWRDIMLTRTADGVYILGNPGDPQAARRLWGYEVRPTTAQTENTAIVGAYGTAAQVFYRTGVTVTASTEHSTYFIDNKVAILAEQRLALAVYRPAAFCTVTGI